MLALLCLVNGLLQPDPLKAVADRVHEQVVQLRSHALIGARGSDGRIAVQETELSGSGVLIGSGLALASMHLAALPDVEGKLAPVESVEILVPDRGVFPATLVGGDAGLDVALFRLEGGESLGGADLSESDPEPDEQVLAIGAINDHIVAVRSAVASVHLTGFVLAAPLGSSFWGGPVFDLRGKLAGIVGPASAVPASLLRKMIERALSGSL